MEDDVILECVTGGLSIDSSLSLISLGLLWHLVFGSSLTEVISILKSSSAL